MKTRSSFEICLPLVLCVAACLVSLPTLILTLIWLTLGAASIGYRSLAELPTDGIPRQWLRGPRSICLWFYHLTWWPWYMRAELREIAARIRKPAFAGSNVIAARVAHRRATPWS